MGTRQAWLRNWFWWLVMAAVAVYLAETLGVSYRGQLQGAYLGFALGAVVIALTATWSRRRRAAVCRGRWVVKIYDPAGTCVAVHETRRAASEAQALAAALEADRDG
jgi:hypothetical protein